MAMEVEELEYIERMIGGRLNRSSVRRHLLIYFGFLGVSIFSVFGVVTCSVVKGAATSAAEKVAKQEIANLEPREIANLLKQDNDFVLKVFSQLDNAVIAFDFEKGCPKGWVNVGTDEATRFAGRTLIVAGETVVAKDRDGFGGTSKRNFDAQGGSEQVVLTVDQLPAHLHEVTTLEGDEAIDGIDYMTNRGNLSKRHTLTTNAVGGDNAHENMPPFISLHFCRKPES